MMTCRTPTEGVTMGSPDTSLLRIHEISESSHQILDPISAEKLATLGRAIGLRPGMRVLDLACGKAEMLAMWAAEHRITGIGVDLSRVFTAAARRRLDELQVGEQITIIQDDAAGYVTDQLCDVACCVGATWIGDGVEGTIDLLRRSVKPDGLILIGEPFWLREPNPDMMAAGGTDAELRSSLTELIDRFLAHGYDVVEMILADQNDWDRYTAASWMNMRRWLDDHPGDDFARTVRGALDRSVHRYTRNRRDALGWGVFVLRPVAG